MSNLREKSDEELTSFLELRRCPDRGRLVLGGFLKRTNEDGRKECTILQPVRKEGRSVRGRERGNEVEKGDASGRDERERDEPALLHCPPSPRKNDLIHRSRLSSTR